MKRAAHIAAAPSPFTLSAPQRHQKKENKAKSYEVSHATQASRTSITANETSLIRLKRLLAAALCELSPQGKKR